MLTPDEAIKRLPDSVRVGPFDFKLEIWPKRLGDAYRCWGEFRPIDATIALQDEWPSTAKMVDTLLHEICHAVFYVQQIKDVDQEERIVSNLGLGLTGVFRDNPWLALLLHDAFSSQPAAGNAIR